ncbi:MAG TPA: signal peptidase I [Armatimonadota bacterium]
MSLLDWLANLPFIAVLAIGVGLYALHAATMRAEGLPDRARRGFGELVESLLFAWVLVFVILKPFFVQAFFIPSQSMEPTLAGHAAGEPTGLTQPAVYPSAEHDRLLVAKLPFWFRGPRRGEILVFRAPQTADRDGIERDYIKRCIGLPGDTLYVSPAGQDGSGGEVYINGQPLREPYTLELSDQAEAFGPIVIPRDHYFMMGDNRNVSLDSRFWGPLDRDRIVGLAWFRFWPLDKIGFLPRPVYSVPEKPQPALGPIGVMH